jgi:glucosamine--fructose-6-phosphate aminotransferase (isomerizing)
MTVILSPDGFSSMGAGPLSVQLQRRIRDAVLDGHLKSGDNLPPERDMPAMTGLSRVTLRKAVEGLGVGGALVQRRGSGTCVAPPVERREQALSLLTSFSEDMARRGKSVESHWISRKLAAPDPEEIMALGLGAGDCVARLLSGSGPAIARAAKAFRTADPDTILTVARGSSDHAATYLQYAIDLTAGIPVASHCPSIASVYARKMRVSRVACIGISQSGCSPDIVEMMHASREGGALTLAITNFADSRMALASAHCFPFGAGDEKSVAATKPFVTSVVAGLQLLAEWQQDTSLLAALADLPQAMDGALSLDWWPLAARLISAPQANILGPAFAFANEAALKLKETCGLNAVAYSLAEMLHGPFAIANSHFFGLVLAVEDSAVIDVAQTVERLVAKGADVFITGATAKGAITLPAGSRTDPLLAPLLRGVACYHFVMKLARQRGLDPDKPPFRNKVTETI